MLKFRTYLEWYGTPYDETAPQLIEDRILLLYQSAKGPVVQSDYGANAPYLFAGMGSVLDRGLPLYAVFDHTQFSGPTERRMFAPFIARYQEGWTTQHCVTGTSPMHGQIAHAKRRVFNAPVDGYDVPDADFDTLEDAIAAGYPITQLGSLNLTTRATEQVNDAIFVPSKILAAEVCRQIMAEREFIRTHQQRLQPFPTSGAA